MHGMNKRKKKNKTNTLEESRTIDYDNNIGIDLLVRGQRQQTLGQTQKGVAAAIA